MKIGIVAFSGMYPFKYGGPQEAIYHIVRELSNSTDMSFRIFLRLYENNFGEEYLRDLENVEVVPFLIKPKEEIKLLYASSKLVIKSKDLDLIHYNAPPYFMDVPTLRLLRKPVTFDFHGGLFAENLFEDRFFLKATASVLRKTFKLTTAPFFTRCIVHSQYMKEKAVSHGMSESRISVIPIGINLKEFDEAKRISLESDPTLLFVGRFESIKGCHILLRALPKVIKEYPKLRLYIIGKGPMESYLKDITSELELSNNVCFWGNVTRETLLTYYKSVDLCIFPSTYNEGFGITVLEAMAAGSAVIASATGGMKERIVTGVDGYLVNRNDVHDLTEKISLLLNDTDLRKMVAKNASVTAEKYNWPIIAKKYKKFFGLD